MSDKKPLPSREEHMLRQSYLLSSDIITLPAVAREANTPPAHLAVGLPCEARFLIRLADDEQGRSRWTTPQAWYGVSHSRFLPPLHRASQNPHAARAAQAAHNMANRAVLRPPSAGQGIEAVVDPLSGAVENVEQHAGKEIDVGTAGQEEGIIEQPIPNSPAQEEGVAPTQAPAQDSPLPETPGPDPEPTAPAPESPAPTTMPAPTTPSSVPAPTSSETNTPSTSGTPRRGSHRGGLRRRRGISPRPMYNFPNAAQQKEMDDWDERHKDDVW